MRLDIGIILTRFEKQISSPGALSLGMLNYCRRWLFLSEVARVSSPSGGDRSNRMILLA